MDDRIISIPEAVKNKVMENVRPVDWFQWWMMDDRYTPYPCKRLWRTRLCASGLFGMIDDKYAPYPCPRLQKTVMAVAWFRWWMRDDRYTPYLCQRLQRTRSWETGDWWIILDEGWQVCTLSMPEAAKNKDMGNWRLVDYFGWGMTAMHLIHARGYEEQGHGDWWMQGVQTWMVDNGWQVHTLSIPEAMMRKAAGDWWPRGVAEDGWLLHCRMSSYSDFPLWKS